jgi:transposase InsO family protein
MFSAITAGVTGGRADGSNRPAVAAHVFTARRGAQRCRLQRASARPGQCLAEPLRVNGDEVEQLPREHRVDGLPLPSRHPLECHDLHRRNPHVQLPETQQLRDHFRDILSQRLLDADSGRSCEPILLACVAYPSNEGLHTRRAFQRIFREYGLPRAILSDNGSPFGSPGLARLSTVSLWWIPLGIRIERIVPGYPQDNGAPERMHRTLKAEAARPPEQTLERQQKRLDEFRHTYNHERPHESLGQKRTATIYRPLPRHIPRRCDPSSIPATSRRGRSNKTG